MKALVLYSSILLMSQCNKYDNTIAAAKLQVPPYTETGANTFGCLVNGEPWANFGETWINPGESFGSNQPNLVRSNVQYDILTHDTVFYISGNLTVQRNGTAIREEYMSMTIPKNGNLKGIYKLDDKHPFNYQSLITWKGYSSIARNPFIVTIKKDSMTSYPNHIVSGTFNGIIYNYAQTDSLRIVGGVFDVSVQYFP
jgi:hypothetical protein